MTTFYVKYDSILIQKILKISSRLNKLTMREYQAKLIGDF